MQHDPLPHPEDRLRGVRAVLGKGAGHGQRGPHHRLQHPPLRDLPQGQWCATDKWDIRCGHLNCSQLQVKSSSTGNEVHVLVVDKGGRQGSEEVTTYAEVGGFQILFSVHDVMGF